MTRDSCASQTPPSPWVTRFAPMIDDAGRALDLACGGGRHCRLLLDRGHVVAAVDRDLSRLADLDHPNLTKIQADLEDGSPWPLPGQQFKGIIITNYLNRSLFPIILESLAPAGVLIYETFAKGNERFGRPSNPDFLLDPGELLDVVRGRLRVLAFEDLTVDSPKPACVQRICARDEV